MPSFHEWERNVISPKSHAELVVDPRLEPMSSDCQCKGSLHSTRLPVFTHTCISMGGGSDSKRKEKAVGLFCTHIFRKGARGLILASTHTPPLSKEIANTWGSESRGKKKKKTKMLWLKPRQTPHALLPPIIRAFSQRR